MTETDLSDDDIRRIHESAEPRAEDGGVPKNSRAIEKAFMRAKRASAQQNERSRQSVKELRRQREDVVTEVVPDSAGQTSIFDYK